MTDIASATTSRRNSTWSDVLDLLASMRFSISLLSVICIASVIGTVVKQNEPYNNYVNQFGPFWAEVFNRFHLFNVYSAGWFLLILAFLVISTSLCIARNTPKILADLRTFKENIRTESLNAFHHKAAASLPLDRNAALAQVSAVLGRHGWQAKAQVRPDGTMVAARAGRVNKLGYIAAHSAIVLVCLGGLFDGDLIVKAQMWLGGKTSFGGNGLIRDVAPEHRLPVTNPTFRGNLAVPEGARAGTAVLSMPDGVVLQDLPFDVELKQFKVEYYSTGMPKLFASDIVIHDHATGEAIPATVKVNEPVFHDGVAIYQSSFDDGGSSVTLQALPMRAGGKPFTVDSRVGESTRLSNGNEQLTLEVSALKVINVENLGATGEGGTDVRAVNLASTLDKHLGSGARGDKEKTLHNVGPAITYKLRDASGQAREYHNYMVPMALDGQRVFVAGVRDNPGDPFRYLRIPADENMSIAGWQRLHAALLDPALRDQAARRYATLATPPDKPEMAEQLRLTGQRALGLFAGAEQPAQGGERSGGLVAFSQFIESTVPQAERARVSEVLLRILNGSLYELNQLAREQAQLKPLEPGPTTEAFMTQSVMSLSDSFFYPAPVMLQLADFKQVQASVFQVARAPGKKLVYLGAILLIIGVFAMLYVRERRLWVWLSNDPDQPAQTRVLMALSVPRRTLDLDAQFNTLQREMLAGGTVIGDKT
jgi:cytochrome c biogenesis protein